MALTLAHPPTPFNATLGARVKALRSARGMRIEALSTALNCSHVTVRHLEGGTGCKAEVLLRLAQTFHVSLAYLAGLTDDPTPDTPC